MAKSTPSVVFLRLNDEGTRPVRNLITDSDVKPGQLMIFTLVSSVLHVDVSAVDDAKILPIVCIESPYSGENVAALAGTYAADSICRFQVAQPGDEAYVLIGQSQTVAFGDALNSGSGFFEKITTGPAMAIALEAVTTTTAELFCRVVFV